ncbi:hypothetical protein DIPPA_33704, partial [Diplonema papillatum]
TPVLGSSLSISTTETDMMASSHESQLTHATADDTQSEGAESTPCLLEEEVADHLFLLPPDVVPPRVSADGLSLYITVTKTKQGQRFGAMVRGTKVTQIEADSPAERAGLQRAMHVLEVEGVPAEASLMNPVMKKAWKERGSFVLRVTPALDGTESKPRKARRSTQQHVFVSSPTSPEGA